MRIVRYVPILSIGDGSEITKTLISKVMNEVFEVCLNTGSAKIYKEVDSVFGVNFFCLIVVRYC